MVKYEQIEKKDIDAFVQKHGIYYLGVLDKSPRGYHAEPVNEIKAGDRVIILNTIYEVI